MPQGGPGGELKGDGVVAPKPRDSEHCPLQDWQRSWCGRSTSLKTTHHSIFGVPLELRLSVDATACDLCSRWSQRARLEWISALQLLPHMMTASACPALTVLCQVVLASSSLAQGRSGTKRCTHRAALLGFARQWRNRQMLPRRHIHHRMTFLAKGDNL